MLSAAQISQSNSGPPEDLDIRPGTIREVLRQYEQQWPFRDDRTMRTVMVYLVSNTKDVYGRIADRFPRDMYLDSLLVKERHISAVNAAKLVGDYTLLKQQTITDRQYEHINLSRRQKPPHQIDLSGLPFTLSSFLYSRNASSTDRVELKPSAKKTYSTVLPSGWLPQKTARSMLIALGVDAELITGLSEEQTVIYERGGLPNFGPISRIDLRPMGVQLKETMADTAKFYETFYAGGQDSPVGRAFGTFIAGIVTVPLSAAESIEFLTDPSYRDIVNPGGTTFVDYLGAVVNLGLDLGVINVEGIALKAAAKALKPLFKSIGKKISAKFAADGMDHAIADNIGKKIDEAIKNADEAVLAKAVDDSVQRSSGAGSSGDTLIFPQTGGRYFRATAIIDRDITAVVGRRRARLGSSIKKLSSGLDPDDLLELIEVGSLLFEKGVTKFNDWSLALIRQFGQYVRPYLTIVFRRIKRGGDSRRIVDDLAEVATPLAKPQGRGTIIVSGDELGRNLVGIDLYRAAQNHVKLIAGKVVRITKDNRLVEISSSASTKATNHPDLAKLVIAMEDIIRNSRYLRTLPNYKPGSSNTIFHHYVSDVRLEGKMRTVILIIREDPNGNLFYDWNFNTTTLVRVRP